MKRALKIVLLLACLLIAAWSVRTLIAGAVWLNDEDTTVGKETMGSGRSGYYSWNLKSIGLSIHTYHDIYKSLPAGGTFDDEGRGMHSWMTSSLIGSYTFEGGLHRDEPWNSDYNAKYFRSIIPEFLNPGLPAAPVKNADEFALSHYASNQFVMGPNLAMTFDDISDGTGHTLLVGEVQSLFQPWGAPTNWRDPTLGLNSNVRGFGSHPDLEGVTFLYADGHVGVVSDHVDRGVLKALTTPAGGETVSKD